MTEFADRGRLHQGCASTAIRFQIASSVFASGTAVAFLAAAPAHAQAAQGPQLQPGIPLKFDGGRNVGVTDRARPEFDPVGLRSGSVTVEPRLELNTGYSSNVNGSSNNPMGDAYLELLSAVRTRSEIGAHEVALAADLGMRRHSKAEARDQTNYRLQGDGRLAATRDWHTVPRRSPGRLSEDIYLQQADGATTTVVPYEPKYASLRVQRQVGRSRTTFELNARPLDFKDAKPPDGGLVEQDYRDRVDLNLAVQLEYAPTPSVAVFSQALHSRIDHDIGSSPQSLARDGSETPGLVGATFDITISCAAESPWE